MFDLIAIGAVERAKFKSCRPRRDARKLHARSAFWAAELLNGEQWDCGWVICHAFHLASGGSATLSVTDESRYGAVISAPCAGNSRKATKFRTQNAEGPPVNPLIPSARDQTQNLAEGSAASPASPGLRLGWSKPSRAIHLDHLKPEGSKKRRLLKRAIRLVS